MMRRSMIRTVTSMRFVLFVLFLLLIFVFVLVAEHVRANRTSYHTSESTKSSSTKLVAKECAPGTSNEG